MGVVIRDARCHLAERRRDARRLCRCGRVRARLRPQTVSLAQLYRAATKELAAGHRRGDDAVRRSCARRLRERGVDVLVRSSRVVVQRSSDEQTTKGLFRLRDGKEVEAVLMEHYGDRTTVCISSQAGCAFACAFCSTGQAGFTRNLTPTEIFDQARFFARELAARGKKHHQHRVHGHGRTVPQLRRGDGRRRAAATIRTASASATGTSRSRRSAWWTRSTALPTRHLQVNLAISLHAPSDAVRSRHHAGQSRVLDSRNCMAACERYVADDQPQSVLRIRDARRGQRHGRVRARTRAPHDARHLYHVNLIPYNSTPDATVRGTQRRAHLGVRSDPRSRRRARHRPSEHGPRHRRRLRPTPRRNATEALISRSARRAGVM